MMGKREGGDEGEGEVGGRSFEYFASLDDRDCRGKMVIYLRGNLVVKNNGNSACDHRCVSGCSEAWATG